MTEPLQGTTTLFAIPTQGSSLRSQPWAVRRNSFGVKDRGSFRTMQPPARQMRSAKAPAVITKRGHRGKLGCVCVNLSRAGFEDTLQGPRIYVVGNARHAIALG